MEQLSPLEAREQAIDMLNKLYSLFIGKYQNRETAWKKMMSLLHLDFIGITKINDCIDWMSDRRFRHSVLSCYDRNHLFSDECLSEVMPFSIDRKSIGSAVKNGMKILDTNTGAGLRIIQINKNHPDCVFNCYEKNPLLKDVALINFAIFRIKVNWLSKEEIEMILNSDKSEKHWINSSEK